MRTLDTIRRASIASLAVLLTACGTFAGPGAAGPPGPPSSDLPPAFTRSEGFPPGPVGHAQWWRALADPVLDGLIERGLAANLDRRIGAERVARSRALAAAAGAALLPGGGANASVLARQLARPEAPALPESFRRTETAQAAFDMNWEVDLFGRLRAVADASGHRVRMAEADREGLTLSIVAEIAQAWYERVGALEQAALSRAVIESRRGAVALLERRASAGLSAPIDLERMRAELEAAGAELPAFEAAAIAATHRLAVLIGESPSTFAPPSPSSAPPSVIGLSVPEPSVWLAGRPDVRAAEASLAAFAHDVTAVRAEFMPRLSLGGALGWVAGSASGLALAPGASWFFLPRLTVPVFDRPRIGARLDAASAAEREALLAYRRAVLVAVEEVETALDRVSRGQERLEGLRRRARHAKAALELATKRHAAGASDLLELLDAQRGARLAEVALAAAVTAQRLHVVTLLRALGPGAVTALAGEGRAHDAEGSPFAGDAPGSPSRVPAGAPRGGRADYTPYGGSTPAPHLAGHDLRRAGSVPASAGGEPR